MKSKANAIEPIAFITTILEFFDQNGFPPSTSWLKGCFNCSLSTINSNLRILEQMSEMRMVSITGRSVWWPSARPTVTEMWKAWQSLPQEKQWIKDDCHGMPMVDPVPRCAHCKIGVHSPFQASGSGGYWDMKCQCSDPKNGGCGGLSVFNSKTLETAPFSKVRP